MNITELACEIHALAQFSGERYALNRIRELLQAAIEEAVAKERARVEKELDAWRERFPSYCYRPQDDCVSLAHEARIKP